MTAPLLQHRAEALAALFPPLLIEAERVAATVWQGVHGRRRAGAGETFWQFRPYEWGDPAERIDWRQSARSTRVFIKEREWEAAQTAYVWADASGSMRYASSKNISTKAGRAQLLMLALASLLLRGGEKVVWCDERRTIAAHGNSGLSRIAARLGGAAPGAEQSRHKNSSLPPDIPFAKRAHMIMCSDFLMPEEALIALMRRYAALNLRGCLVHILDPVEESFAHQGRLEMQGLEGEAPLLLPNAGALHEAYAEKLAAHKARLENLAKSAGWFYARHITSTKPHRTLLEIYQALTAS
jgi:uncharacterized protein (DUF58 family)